MEIVEFGHMTAGQRDELQGEEDDPFGGAGITLEFQRKQQHVALSDERGRLVASAGMVVVEVEVADERFEVVGLGGVIVNAADRGRGLARTVVTAAITKAATLGPRFMLLFCHPDRARALSTGSGGAKSNHRCTCSSTTGTRRCRWSRCRARWRTGRPGRAVISLSEASRSRYGPHMSIRGSGQ